MEEDIEAQVHKRYIELAGRIENGRMVNRDKEARAREYVNIQKKLIQEIIERNRVKENSTYGELIVQTNEVQYHLTKFILFNSFNRTKNFEKSLERLQFGSLINYLNVWAQTPSDLNLISHLNIYKKKRDVLAHKMFTSEKLSPTESESAIKSGKEIIQSLIENMKKKQEYLISGTDKLSDFPNQFNNLAKLVESLEKKIWVLQKEVEKLKR